MWLPPEVVATVAGLDRPPAPGLRWTRPDQWHVTLSFLGGVAEPAVGAVEAGLARLEAPAAAAALGPATRRLGRSLLVVPVTGLDAVAAAVAGVALPRPGDGRPFTGHLTLARAGRRGAVPAALAGAPLSARWTVTEVALVRSRPSPAGSRYETLATATLST